MLMAAAAALWVVNCSGPRPVVTDVQLHEPDRDGAPYRVEAIVRNAGGGRGQVTVNVRLRERASGRTIQTGKQVVLEARESALVLAELPAPRGNYAPEVEAEYPPR